MNSLVRRVSMVSWILLVLGLAGCSGLFQKSVVQKEKRGYAIPYGLLDPAGKLIPYGTVDSEQHALDCQLSPDGSVLAVEGRNNLVLIDAKTGRVLQTLHLAGREPSTYSGLTWSPDGKQIFWSTSGDKKGGSVDRIRVAEKGSDGQFSFREWFQFPRPKGGKRVIPNQITFSQDGKTLLVALSGKNQLGAVDLQSKSLRTLDVGKFPYGVAVAGNRAYVTNWAGRVPRKDDYTVSSGWNSPFKNERIVGDAKTGASASGTISVVDLASWRVVAEIAVGLHPNAILASRDGSRLFVANANDDNVSVIDTKTNRVVETIPILLEGGLPQGTSPDALALSPDGKTLYVAASAMNAVAVVKLGEKAAPTAGTTEARSRVAGFIPTGAFPGGLAVSPNGKTLFVANIEGIFSRATTQDPTDAHFFLFHPNSRGKKPSAAGNFNAHRELGYVSMISVPNAKKLAAYTARAEASIGYQLAVKNMKNTLQPPRQGVKPVPVPERVGEPSVFKHVLYIIKENRSYDQVLGDMPEGNGDSTLTVFGEKVTPNEHKLAREFLLLDNFYVDGKCSGEGHPWADAGFVTDYVERHVRAWFRGYYHIILDAMVAPKTGYIWNSVLLHGKSFRNYGETLGCEPENNKNVSWSDFYKAYTNNQDTPPFKNLGTIRAMVENASPIFPGYDHHKIPDVLRARAFIRELHQYEKNGGFPNFMIMILPADHTTGVRPDYPTPRAMVADNDLALGQIIEALSKSKFWKNTAVFVTEDDSQNGWDHVSAYRTTGFVFSAYSRLRKTVHTHYDQLSMIHTMQQILGLPPLNYLVLAAPIMRDCFSSTPDLTPYKAVSNRIPLNELNPRREALNGKARYWADLAVNRLTLELDDDNNDDMLNHMIWYSVKGYNTPYPTAFGEPETEREVE